MPNERTPWVVVARGIEDLLRAAADALAAARAGFEVREPEGEKPAGAPKGVLGDLGPFWEWGKRHAVEPLRSAVRQESCRWEARAADDPAAARVHEVFQTLLEILEDEPEAPPPSRGRSWSERRRKPATGGTERRSPAKRSRR